MGSTVEFGLKVDVFVIAGSFAGIFNPSSSVSSTVTGFSGLGSVTAECTANGVLRISVGDSTGNLINITGITAKEGKTADVLVPVIDPKD